ncbi:MAG TPA: ABC transporter permease [Gemmatimonadaceae bacterium]|nr:ABC transporter permease [Gemmatimonadaceae bacterium]
MDILPAELHGVTRFLRHELRFAALVVFTLALGIGSTAAVFGMADQLLLRPLPGVRDGGRVAYLRLNTPAGAGKALTTPEFDELGQAATLLGALASHNFPTFDVSVGDVHGVRVDAESIYGDYFEILGVRPAAGRLLLAAETRSGSDPTRVVISERLAASLYGSAAGAVGKRIYLNNHPMTVLGVAGDGFRGSRRDVQADVWLPMGASASISGDSVDKIFGRSGAPHEFLLARMRADVDQKAATDQLRDILRRLARDEPAYDSDARLVEVEPTLTLGLGMPPEIRPRIESLLQLLAGVAALVLFVACANVTNLLLFRNVGRRRAVVTRMALGASPGRIARELLVQSLLLGILGAVAGLGIGWFVSFLFRGQSLGSVAAFHGFPLDHRIALFAVLASMVTTLLFGTMPAVLAGRVDLGLAMRQADVRHGGRLATFRSALSAGQFAITLTLGVGALLLVRTMHNLTTADTGLDFHGVVSLWQSHRVDMSRAESSVLARRLLAAVEAVPGVGAAAMGPPDLDTHYGGRAQIGLPGASPEQRVDARVVPVTPSWFGIFHIAAMRGRLFRDDDWREGPPYNAVLTASLARKLFGSEDAVDRTLGGVFGRPEPHVIGVVPNLSGNQSPDVPKDVVFVTYAFPPVTSGAFSMVVRTRSFDAQLAENIRGALGGILPDQPVEQPMPLSAASAHREQQTLSRLLLLLAALAAVLAAVGLYSVIAFVVAGRKRELAVRMALGAEAWRVGRLVANYATAIVVGGTLLGLGGAYVMSQTLRSRLYGVAPLDPASYIASAALLGVVAAIACWVPTWRAMRLDPVMTLREE